MFMLVLSKVVSLVIRSYVLDLLVSKTGSGPSFRIASNICLMLLSQVVQL